MSTSNGPRVDFGHDRSAAAINAHVERQRTRARRQAEALLGTVRMLEDQIARFNATLASLGQTPSSCSGALAQIRGTVTRECVVAQIEGVRP